jgi:hypothetical protein
VRGVEGGGQGLTGVWVEGHKLAAIGVRARKCVTYHGLALNVSTGGCGCVMRLGASTLPQPTQRHTDM